MRTPASPRLDPGAPGPPAVEKGGGGGGGGGDWVLLTTAQNSVVAHLIQGRLASQGIEAMLDTSNPSPGAWLLPFGDSSAPVKVFVRRRDVEGAALLLHEVGHEPPDPAASGSRAGRRAFAFVMGIVVLMFVLEVLDSAPCVLRFLCF